MLLATGVRICKKDTDTLSCPKLWGRGVNVKKSKQWSNGGKIENKWLHLNKISVDFI